MESRASIITAGLKKHKGLANMAQVSKGDFIELDYTGKTKDEGILFDTTLEREARQHGIYDEKAEYRPVVICVGERHLVPGLDRHLEGAEVDKDYTFELKAEDAFGKKDAKLLQLIPTARFRKDNIQPFPGLQVNVDNSMGVVKTVTGGRTLVDFNHPLSGKDIVYKIKVGRILVDDAEKVKHLLKMQLGIKDAEVTITDGKAEVKSSQKIPDEIIKIIESGIKKLVPAVKGLVFGKDESQKKDESKSEGSGGKSEEEAREKQEHSHEHRHSHEHSHQHSADDEHKH